MELIDKYGYLDDALNYIERNIIGCKDYKKLAKKAGVNEEFFKNLSKGLKGFSEKIFLTLIRERVEEKHSSLSGADAEVAGVDISIEKQKKSVFILLRLLFEITVDGESEDKVKINIKIFSKNNIVLS